MFFMPKIAVVIPKYGLVGGAEQFAAMLTSKLCSRTDYTFQVFANRWQAVQDTVGFEKIPILTFPKFMTSLSFAWCVQKRLQRGAFDLVHSHERIFSADLYTIHGIPHRYWIRSIRQKRVMSLYDLATAWVEKKLVYEGGCHKFIAVSELTKTIFLEEYPIDTDRVAVIHPGVDLSDCVEDKEATRNDIRRGLNMTQADLVLMFASMNFELKGLDEVIGALANFASGLKLIVAGKGDIQKYKALAQKAGVHDKIIFTGVVDKKRLNELYRAADLYLMPSKFDTFGMVVLEAMAAGLPVIVSDRVGAKDLIDEGKNGFILDSHGGPEAMASRIRLLLNRNRRNAMAGEARATALSNGWEKAATRYSDLYAETLERKKGKGR